MGIFIERLIFGWNVRDLVIDITDYEEKLGRQHHRNVYEGTAAATQPSGSCQVCMSEDQLANDYIITCEICRSCIHQSHYGSELLNQSPEIWQCERCRYFTENGVEEIKCSFCPNLRGIMKQYLFDNKKIWVFGD